MTHESSEHGVRCVWHHVLPLDDFVSHDEQKAQACKDGREDLKRVKGAPFAQKSVCGGGGGHKGRGGRGEGKNMRDVRKPEKAAGCCLPLAYTRIVAAGGRGCWPAGKYDDVCILVICTQLIRGGSIELPIERVGVLLQAATMALFPRTACTAVCG